ncbi:VOC family protein [Salininema proteolyticum]|uniref:VOC family protein n=1 Tax=Salininema proteolyticum TaxID=1607685 RepID=A0ABV8TUT4_9ACTN
MGTPTLQTGHIGLNVTDLARSTEFYRKIFDLDVFSEQAEGDKRFAFLGHGGDIVLTLWQQSTGAFAADRPGLHHLSFQAPDIATVHKVEGTLKELGADLFYDGIVPHGEGASSGGVFFADPDGIRLEVYSPVGADAAEAPTAGAPTCGFF